MKVELNKDKKPILCSELIHNPFFYNAEKEYVILFAEKENNVEGVVLRYNDNFSFDELYFTQSVNNEKCKSISVRLIKNKPICGYVFGREYISEKALRERIINHGKIVFPTNRIPLIQK